MRSAPTYLGRAGDELARGRLAQYVRYAELVAEQEQALESDDLDRFEELGEMISALRGEIGSAAGAGGPATDPTDAAQALKDALAANRRILRRLTAMRSQNADKIKRIVRRRPQARKYAEDGVEAPTTHLDLTL